MKAAPVTVRQDTITLPTYIPAAPDKNPMFFEKRVYQGSSGRIYPLPVIDRIAEKPVPTEWQAIHLENEFLYVMILPQIGGRIQRILDKTNGYDVVYYNPVIKPALVGPAGPWVSGGIEFNWPQHHRPSTFMPTVTEIEHGDDGSITVWLSEHDPLARMKGMHGVCLRPGTAVVEVKARVYNRTPDVQTFLWWANVATEVNENYQSFFPADATFVADHAKRAMSTFPLCDGSYYGVDYAGRARNGVAEAELPTQFLPGGDYPANDLSWYSNIPVPTSYMCMGTQENFFGGYDHGVGAGVIHVANHHISPGKKQWTWGNHEFGYSWDRCLTDADEHGVFRPYIELMAGVYTDNQPDFSYLQPGETKTWVQSWYPIRAIGVADLANVEAAVSLSVSGKTARIGVSTTAVFPAAVVTLSRRSDGKSLASFTRDLSPSSPFVDEVSLKQARLAEELVLTVADAAGRVLVRHSPAPPAVPPTAQELAAIAPTEPNAPDTIASADELYFTGLHLEQYRHATRCPSGYWMEALRRDAGDSRCNLALGRWHLRRGEFASAETYLRASIARQTFRNPNPADGEALYQLGRTLRYLGRDQDAYDAFYKSTWNQAWASAAFHAIAEIDCSRQDWPTALDHLTSCLRLNTDNLRARALQTIVLLQLGRKKEADAVLAASSALDPLDPWTRQLSAQAWAGDNQMRLDLAFDFARAGLWTDALEILAQAAPEPESGTAPMIAYTRAWLLERSGDPEAAKGARSAAAIASPDYCFPARLEEIGVLESAIAANPKDARAPFYLGHLLYDRRRHREAIARWEAAVALDPGNAIAWRCLGIGYVNILGKPAKARAAFDKAVAAMPKDARLLFERDQLRKRQGDSPRKRLRALEEHSELVAQRDDLTVEICALYNQTGQPEKAEAVLAAHHFQPWEGGEGQALGQHVRAQLLLGRKALAEKHFPIALTHFEQAMACPANLAEVRHLLANKSDVQFWLGEARAAVGDQAGARAAWTAAATFKGDFQNMSVRAFSELTYFSALACAKLGQKSKAEKLFRDLLDYAKNLQHTPAKIDYFATSLPTMLLFDEDLQFRQETTALFLQAQAQLGLGHPKRARKLLESVLQRDPNHTLAQDLSSHEAGPA